ELFGAPARRCGPIGGGIGGPRRRRRLRRRLCAGAGCQQGGDHDQASGQRGGAFHDARISRSRRRSTSHGRPGHAPASRSSTAAAGICYAPGVRNGWILILLFTVSTAVGCSPRLRDPKTALGKIQRDDAAFVERVAQARGLTAGRRARIVFHHSQSAFTRELERHIGSEGDDDESDLALYGAFDLGMNQSPSSTFAAVQREQVVAFYDDDTHTVHVRLSKPATPENDQEVIWTLA